jgi:hypothetical protein
MELKDLLGEPLKGEEVESSVNDTYMEEFYDWAMEQINNPNKRCLKLLGGMGG